MTTSDTKLLSASAFVDQINAAYESVLKADTDALKHGIDCGHYLNLAQENIKAVKGQWLPWLKANTKIPQTTASLYMRLDTHREDLGHAKTIREAIKKLPKQTRTRRTPPAPSPSQQSPSPVFDEKGFDEHLKNLASDELEKKLEPEKLEELAQRKLKALNENDEQRKEFIVSLLKDLTIAGVVDALTDAFEVGDLKALIEGVSDYLPELEPKLDPAIVAAQATAQPQSDRRF